MGFKKPISLASKKKGMASSSSSSFPRGDIVAATSAHTRSLSCKDNSGINIHFKSVNILTSDFFVVASKPVMPPSGECVTKLVVPPPTKSTAESKSL